MATKQRYVIHSHPRVEDRLTLGFFSLTFRQAATLLMGGSLAYSLWKDLPKSLLAVRIAVVALILLMALALAYVRFRGRNLDTWLIIWARYYSQPRCYVWRRLPDPALLPSAVTTLPKAKSPDEESQE